MNESTQLTIPVQADEPPRCDLCGGLAEDGYEIRYHGRRDPVTGYQDESIICSYCIEADDDGRYEAADAAYDLSEGN